MAINRNLEKVREGNGAKYDAHPTAPKGYAWDTHFPNENESTTPAKNGEASKPAVRETVSAEVQEKNGNDQKPKTIAQRVNTPHQINAIAAAEEADKRSTAAVAASVKAGT